MFSLKLLHSSQQTILINVLISIRAIIKFFITHVGISCSVIALFIKHSFADTNTSETL